MDHLVGTGAVAEIVVMPCGAPIKQDLFSLCEQQEDLSPGLSATEDWFGREEDQGEPQLLLKTQIEHFKGA